MAELVTVGVLVGCEGLRDVILSSGSLSHSWELLTWGWVTGRSRGRSGTSHSQTK
jgi:hypothetical protein